MKRLCSNDRRDLKEIERVDVDGSVVWVGAPMFAREAMALDDAGHLVKSKKIAEAALTEAAKRHYARWNTPAPAVEAPALAEGVCPALPAQATRGVS